MHRVSHFNNLKGALNGQELLNFFEKALEEVDRLDNFILKDGDVVVMNNCGFHHAHDIEPILRHMLFRKRNTAYISASVSPIYNTASTVFIT